MAKGDGDIIKSLLENRGIKNPKEFLTPPPPQFKLDLTFAYALIRSKIKKGKKIVVYGDYDADGICATAILWEALKEAGAQVLPFIPTREKEGYGLSKEGIDSVEADLIITVDNGIVAHEAVAYARSKKIDIIILDHHEKPNRLPEASAIIHTPELCAAGIAYFVAISLNRSGSKNDPSNWLELAAIATITDLLPLIGVNRSIVKYGLELLNETRRVGLRVLFDAAGIEKIGTYEIGYMVGPRLNASGRIESALTALRLLCTKNPERARELAAQLNETNKQRQKLTEEMTIHAIESQNLKFKGQKTEERIIILEHESYHQGVIGLVAGKLVEKFYLPSIVIAKSEGESKASARSISGFNIIEAIRECDQLLINVGGHPMAAGFSIETGKIEDFKIKIKEFAREKISDDMLERTLKIDCELDLAKASIELFEQVSQLAPYGIGNPEPVFASTGKIQNVRTVGTEGRHLKLVIDGFDAIGFNQGHLLPKLGVGNLVRIAYNLDLNTFNGTSKLQLRIKDFII